MEKLSYSSSNKRHELLYLFPLKLVHETSFVVAEPIQFELIVILLNASCLLLCVSRI